MDYLPTYLLSSRWIKCPCKSIGNKQETLCYKTLFSVFNFRKPFLKTWKSGENKTNNHFFFFFNNTFWYICHFKKKFSFSTQPLKFVLALGYWCRLYQGSIRILILPRQKDRWDILIWGRKIRLNYISKQIFFFKKQSKTKAYIKYLHTANFKNSKMDDKLECTPPLQSVYFILVHCIHHYSHHLQP